MSFLIKHYITSLINSKLKSFFEEVNPDDWEFSPGVVQHTARIRGLVNQSISSSCMQPQLATTRLQPHMATR